MQAVKLIFAMFAFISVISRLNAQIIKDADGNAYSSVIMGKQVWMGENLKTTKFNDGTKIPLVTSDNDWKALRSPAYCWLNNDIDNKDVYGALYNWYSVNTKKLCPAGWHVPSSAEWNLLVAFLGSEETAGTKLKEKGNDHWKNSLTTPTDEFGFTALPAGMRLSFGNFPSFANGYCVWWTSTGDLKQNLAWNRGLFFSTGRIYKGNESMRSGFSVRCLKD
jgi:uncharacterized protein (TIGR02145 family)